MPDQDGPWGGGPNLENVLPVHNSSKAGLAQTDGDREGRLCFVFAFLAGHLHNGPLNMKVAFVRDCVKNIYVYMRIKNYFIQQIRANRLIDDTTQYLLQLKKIICD